MENNSLLIIVLAFVLGFMCSQMMKQMCGCQLVEGNSKTMPRYNAFFTSDFDDN
jgi:hypothetical protein